MHKAPSFIQNHRHLAYSVFVSTKVENGKCEFHPIYTIWLSKYTIVSLYFHLYIGYNYNEITDAHFTV